MCRKKMAATGVCEKTSISFQIYTKCGYRKRSIVFAIIRYQFMQSNNRQQTYFSTLDEIVTVDNA